MVKHISPLNRNYKRTACSLKTSHQIQSSSANSTHLSDDSEESYRSEHRFFFWRLSSVSAVISCPVAVPAPVVVVDCELIALGRERFLATAPPLLCCCNKSNPSLVVIRGGGSGGGGGLLIVALLLLLIFVAALPFLVLVVVSRLLTSCRRLLTVDGGGGFTALWLLLLLFLGNTVVASGGGITITARRHFSFSAAAAPTEIHCLLIATTSLFHCTGCTHSFMHLLGTEQNRTPLRLI